MADLAVHGAAGACREDPAIDQCQSCVELLGEIGRSTAVISESRHRRQSVLIPARPSEARLHSPNGQERPRRDAEALLDGRQQCRIGLLECAPARDDGRTAAFGEKLIERQTHAPLVTVSSDGCSRIVSRDEGCERGSADALSPRFIGELLLPRVEASRRTAALRGTSFAGHPHQRHQDCDGDRLNLPTLSHSELLSRSLHQTKRGLPIPAGTRRHRRLYRRSRSELFTSEMVCSGVPWAAERLSRPGSFFTKISSSRGREHQGIPEMGGGKPPMAAPLTGRPTKERTSARGTKAVARVCEGGVRSLSSLLCADYALRLMRPKSCGPDAPTPASSLRSQFAD